VNGEVDPMYQVARRVLLNVIEKLDGLRQSVVLVGAQAVHLRVADVPAQLIAYTTDGDIAVDPATVAPEPDLAAVMDAAGMRKGGTAWNLEPEGRRTGRSDCRPSRADGVQPFARQAWCRSAWALCQRRALRPRDRRLPS